MSPPILSRSLSEPSGLLLANAFSLLLQKSARPRSMNTDLASLFRDLPVLSMTGDASSTVKSLCIDSRRVAPGALFFALGGRRTDGNLYVEEAIHRGAAAIVSESPGKVPPRAVYIQVEDIREVLAAVAARFFGHPARELELCGVTGTNGKTTVTTLLQHFLSEPGQPVGLLGTVSYELGQRTLPAYRTTPEATEIQSMFLQMREAGCRRAVMEVSSHGIDQKRVSRIPFKVAAFTNLTQDHLDYHPSIEDYFEVKARLFTGANGVPPEVAVINIDDPWGRRLLSRLPNAVRSVTCGVEREADFQARNLVLGPQGTRFELVWPGGELEVWSPLLGRYNVSNLLVAMACAHACGLVPADLAARLRRFPGVPGRMEKIEAGQPFNVLVDYAHTDDALRNAVTMLRPITPGRLLVVFGCGGCRDRAKRPLMTRAVQEGSDHCWATADNPRRESLEGIFEDMRGGVTDPDRISWVTDRRRAISLALDAAGPGDTLLIAGKGHETYQEFADSVVPFDDRLTARELIQLKYASKDLNSPS